MIDYDKLKLAHTKADNLPFEDWEVRHTYGKPDNYYVLTFTDDEGLWNEDCYKNLDELIGRIMELTQPNPKYKDAWYVGPGGHPRCTKAMNEDGYMVCDETDNDAMGMHVTMYPTKSELIEAQIAYWTNLQKEFDVQYALSEEGQAKIREGMKQLIEECQHEPERSLYFHADGARSYKCLKCGEFYR